MSPLWNWTFILLFYHNYHFSIVFKSQYSVFFLVFKIKLLIFFEFMKILLIFYTYRRPTGDDRRLTCLIGDLNILHSEIDIPHRRPSCLIGDPSETNVPHRRPTSLRSIIRMGLQWSMSRSLMGLKSGRLVSNGSPIGLRSVSDGSPI